MAILTFHEATGRHRMLSEAVGRVNGHFGREKGKRAVDAMGDGWGAALGLGGASVVARSVRATIPLDYVPLMRAADGIPAAYFVARLGDVMMGASKLEFDDDFAMRQLVRKAFELFEERRREADQIEEGFGYDRSDSWKMMRECEDFSGKVTPQMLEIARLAGRMYDAFRYYALPRPTKDPQEVNGVEQGGEHERMLDDEAASLGIDPEVAVRVSEDKAYQYEMKGEAPRSRGPLVLVLDESGSMHDQRLVWSKACAVALARVARKEGRVVRVVHFAVATHVHDVTEDPRTMLELSRSHLGGGTDIGVAMRVGVREVGALDRQGCKGADIVFISDGIGQYNEAPFKQMKKDDIQLWTVSIDVDMRQHGSHHIDRHLVSYAKKYMHINDKALGDDRGVQAAASLRSAAMDNGHRGDYGAN